MRKPKLLPDGIIIPSSTDFLADVDRHLEQNFSTAGIDQSIMADLAISVSELVNNAIVHGNGYDEAKEVEIRFTISETEIRVVVCDQGRGFDLARIGNPIEDNNLLREVGRGIFIVRNFVDEVHVSNSPTGGACVEIIKKL
jgi:serine/threonine-protein kinase RsbW